MSNKAAKPANGPALPPPATPAAGSAEPQPDAAPAAPKPDPTRYGDWEIGGRCIDF